MARACVIATCLLVLTGVLISGASAGHERRAALRIVSLQPLQLAGSGFASRESVRVTVTTESRTAGRTVRATMRGTFSVRFEAIVADRCSAGISAVARGARGSFASAKALPQLLCPPGLNPPDARRP